MLEIQEKRVVREVACSVCSGYLISAITGRNDDFYRDVLSCVSCGRKYKVEDGELRVYTGRQT